MKTEKSEPKEKLKVLDKAKKKRKTFLRAKIKAAERFATIARQKIGRMVKAVAVIGSLARGDFKPGSDIDVLVILDDTQREVPADLKKKMLAMLNKIGKELDKKMQIQVHTITEMFKFAREGDNIIYNFLRHSDVVYDAGVLKPFKKLLKEGEIKPSKEAVMRSMEGADHYMKKVEKYEEMILERYYRVVTWAGNAFVMSTEGQPASVPELPIVLKQFSDQGVLPQEIPAIAAEVIKEYKSVEHGEGEPDTEKIHQLKPKVQAFLDTLRKEVVGSVVSEGLKGSVKAKIKTMPKVILEFVNTRAFVWLLDGGVYMAHYTDKGLEKVFKSKVEDGSVADFEKVESEELFQAMEVSSLKPLINPNLVEMIISKLPDEVAGNTTKVAVEFPGRAMVDLSEFFVKGKNKPKKKKTAGKGKTIKTVK